MATRTQPTQPGRTHRERSEATRRKLLEATVECLVAYGYAGTSTSRVAKRAGVSRGAPAHHFGDRSDLVIAAVHHVAAQRIALAIGELRRVGDSEDPLDAALDLVWDMHQGPVFLAAAELWNAARVDPELRAHMRQVEPTVTAAITEAARTPFSAYRDPAEFRRCLLTVMDTVRGLLLAGFGLEEGEEKLRARWLRAKEGLRSMVEARCGTLDPGDA